MAMLPNEILAQQDHAAAWGPVADAYRQSVEGILSYGADPRVPQWLDTATAQLLRRPGTMQKTAMAQALLQKLRPMAQVKTLPPVQKGAGVVRIQKGDMMSAYETFLAEVEQVISLAKRDGKVLSNAEAFAIVHKRLPPGSYEAAC